jgi:hypothetical protein
VTRIVIGLLAVMSVSAAQTRQTFTGVISDDGCAEGGHAAMRMGPTDAECTRLCVMLHESKYVLLDGKQVYALSDQNAPEAFAAARVRVTGSLDAKTRTIRVESIAAAE